MPDINDKYLDGGGYAYALEKVIEHVDEAVSAAVSFLPTPQPVAKLSDASDSATLVIQNTYSGFGNVTVAWKKDAEPTSATDGSSIDTPIAENGTYYVRAFAGADSSANPSGSYQIEVTELVPFQHCWGVVWDKTNPSTKLTRLTPETDPYGLVTETVTYEPKAAYSASEAGSSPFDEHSASKLWGAMKMCNVVSGEITAWEDDDSFSLSTADVMVQLPKDAYYDVILDDTINKEYFYLADFKKGTLKHHPAAGHFVARYFQDSTYSSKTGGSAQSVSLTDYRKQATNKGAGYHLGCATERSLIDLLYIIEYADWDSQQVIGNGDTSYQTSNGGTDTMVYHTGISGTTCQYRHIENLWGTYEWLDGFLTQNGKIYICKDYTKFASTITEDYEDFGFSFSTTLVLGYITDLAYDENNSWLFIVPSECSGGSSTTYIPDYGSMEYSSKVFAPYVSRGTMGGGIGLFRFNCASEPDRGMNAARLVYELPKTEKVATPVITIKEV